MGIHFAVNSHQTFINILWIQYLFRGLIEPSCPAASPGCFLAFHHLKTHHPSTPQALKRVLLACAFFQRGKPRFRTFGQKKKDGPKSSRKAGIHGIRKEAIINKRGVKRRCSFANECSQFH